MENVSQYQFDLIEVGKLLLKKQGVNDGLWSVGVQFALGAVNAGPDPTKVMPSMLVSVEKVMLTKATEMTPLTIDAAKT
jgi:hypothetical protein